MDVVRSKDVKPHGLKMVGGVAIEGERESRMVLAGERAQLMELRLNKGFYHPRHHHPEHESIGYLISGRLQMMIDDKEYVLEPGDGWRHRAGVFHSTRALEDSVAVEIHTPPRQEFLARSD